jgi:hypothetical protein
MEGSQRKAPCLGSYVICNLVLDGEERDMEMCLPMIHLDEQFKRLVALVVEVPRPTRY